MDNGVTVVLDGRVALVAVLFVAVQVATLVLLVLLFTKWGC